VTVHADEQPGSRPLRKSPTAFRTIAEVSGELDLPAHVLRFWESKFPQVKPLKRRGGRRYYRPEDIDLLRQIRTLLYTDGYTIRGVQRLLKESGVRPAAGGGRDVADHPGDAASATAELDLDLPGPEHGGEDDGERDADIDGLVDLLDELESIRALLGSHGF
jgi:DNA-binding transcriptional MerR regulator